MRLWSTCASAVLLLLLLYPRLAVGGEVLVISVSSAALQDISQLSIKKTGAEATATKDGLLVSSKYTISGTQHISVVPNTAPAQLRLTVSGQFYSCSNGSKGPVAFSFDARSPLRANIRGYLDASFGSDPFRVVHHELHSPVSIRLKHVNARRKTIGQRLVRCFATRKLIAEIPSQEAELSNTVRNKFANEVQGQLSDAADTLSRLMAATSLDALDSESTDTRLVVTFKEQAGRDMLPPMLADEQFAIAFALNEELATTLARWIFTTDDADDPPSEMVAVRNSLLENFAEEERQFRHADLPSMLANKELVTLQRVTDPRLLLTDRGRVPKVLLHSVRVRFQEENLVSITFATNTPDASDITCTFQIKGSSRRDRIQFRLTALESDSARIHETLATFDPNPKWRDMAFNLVPDSEKSIGAGQQAKFSFHSVVTSQGWAHVNLGAN